MIPISMEFGRSVWYLLTEESSSESLFSILGIPILVALLILLLMAIPILHRRYFPKGIKHTRENLIIGKDVIPWSDIEKVSLKKSEWGNPYLVFYFRDKKSPKSYDMQSFANMEEFVNRLKDSAYEKRFTFEAEGEMKLERESILGIEQYKRAEEVEPGKVTERPEIKEKPEIKLSPMQKNLLIVILAVAFFVGFYVLTGIQFALALFAVVLVHEGGHFVALKVLHLKVSGIFFMPFVGAGVVPEEELPSPGIEAVTAFAGPLAGLSWNLAAHFIESPGSVDFSSLFSEISFFGIFFYIIIVNLALNTLNLLPILPLDGGRILKAALLRGRKSLIPVALITLGCGALITVALGSIFFLVIMGLGFVSLVRNYKKIGERGIEPPSWWASVAILGAWISIFFIYWFTIPYGYRQLIFSYL